MIHAVLQQLYSYIDDLFDGFDGHAYPRYAAYWVATYLLIRVICSICKQVTVGVIERILDSSERIHARDEAAADLAKRFYPNSPTPRSDMAATASPPECADPQSAQDYRKGHRLQAAVEWATLHRWARIDIWKLRIHDAVVHLMTLTGGVASVALSLAAVLWVRPPAGLEAVGGDVISETAEVFNNGLITRVWPIALFLVTAFVVALRSSSLLDRIRARDEAAKDANRLLGELCGALLRIRLPLYKWNEWLSWNAGHHLTNERVTRFTHGQYQSRPNGGVQISRTFAHRQVGRIAELDAHDAEITGSLDGLTDVCARIEAAGLSTVCMRLTKRVSSSTSTLGLFRVYLSARPIDSLVLPGTVKGMLDRSVLMWDDGPIADASSSFDPDAHKWEKLRIAEQEIFNFQVRMSLLVCRLAEVDHHCKTTARYLNRRMHGSSLSRLFGAVKS